MRGTTIISTVFGGAVTCVIAGAIAFLPGCSGNSPTGTTNTQAMVDPNGPPAFSLGTQNVDGVPDGRVEVRGSSLLVNPPSDVSFDLSLVNRSNIPITAPLYLIITDVNPTTVTVLPPDSTGPGDSTLTSSNRWGNRTERFDGPDHLAIVDFSYYLGDDNTLGPGEESLPRRIYFDVPGLTSFSIGYRIEGGAAPTQGVISGVVFFDNNRDGVFDPATELGIPRRSVAIDPWREYPTGMPIETRTTDAMGRYRFEDRAAGVHTVEVIPDPDWIATTPNPLLVTLVPDTNGNVSSFDDANFGFFDPTPPDPLRLFQAHVGPGVGVTEIDTIFVNPPIDSMIVGPMLAPRYTLVVSRPIFFRATPQYVDEARVWINDEMVWEFECPDSMPPPVYGDCAPDYWTRIELPFDLVAFGENNIRITVLGGEETFLGFAVERSTGFWRDPQ